MREHTQSPIAMFPSLLLIGFTQVFFAHRWLRESGGRTPPIRNVVFMGMGEPLNNPRAVNRAIQTMTDPFAFGLGRSHITVSQSRHAPGVIYIFLPSLWVLVCLRRCRRSAHLLPRFVCLRTSPYTLHGRHNTPPNRRTHTQRYILSPSLVPPWLRIRSVHAARDDVRRLLVPTTVHPMTDLRDAFADMLIARSNKHHGPPGRNKHQVPGRFPKRYLNIMVECTLLDGLNDSREDAEALVELVRGLPGEPKVNLLPYNDIGVPGYRRSPEAKVGTHG